MSRDWRVGSESWKAEQGGGMTSGSERRRAGLPEGHGPTAEPAPGLPALFHLPCVSRFCFRPLESGDGVHLD